MTDEPTTDLAIHVVPESVLDFASGELIPATDTPRIAAYLADIRELERGPLKDAKRACAIILEDELRRQGIKTVHYGRLDVTMSEEKEIVWDMEILEELREAGLPEERFGELVKEEVSYKVSAAVAKQIAAANETYAEIIGRARTDVDKGARVSVKRP
jgi:histone H3/H4